MLSRELKVHCNSAKRMLYDFHCQQNAKETGSVYACYLVDGTPKSHEKAVTNGHQFHVEDHHVQSSPCMSSMPQQDQDEIGIPFRGITLVREEELEGEESGPAVTALGFVPLLSESDLLFLSGQEQIRAYLVNPYI